MYKKELTSFCPEARNGDGSDDVEEYRQDERDEGLDKRPPLAGKAACSAADDDMDSERTMGGVSTAWEARCLRRLSLRSKNDWEAALRFTASLPGLSDCLNTS